MPSISRGHPLGPVHSAAGDHACRAAAAPTTATAPITRLLAGRLRRRDLQLRIGGLPWLNGWHPAPAPRGRHRPDGRPRGLLADASDGGVFSFGDTQFYGSIPGLGLHPAGSGLPHSLNAPIVGMVPSHDQGGYLMVASDGGVFAFGDARFAGSCPGIGGCAGAAVAVMPDASGNGYWLITSTGNVYAFGDAHYFGAPGHGTVTSAVATPDGKGYWVLLSDGEVFPYGDAASFGSPSSSNFNDANPATAIFATSDGAGYWVASALGAVFNLGDAPNDGGMAGTHLNGSIIAASGS